MTKGKIALELYSVRDDCVKDFFDTIRQVAAIGYERVAFAGYYDKTAAEIKKLLDELHLKVAGMHIGLDSLEGSVDFKKIISACENYNWIEWYIIEQEEYPSPPVETAKRNFENFKERKYT